MSQNECEEVPLYVYKKKLYILEKEKDVKTWKLFDKVYVFTSFIDIVCSKINKFLFDNKEKIYETDIIWEKIRLLYTMKKNLLKSNNRYSLIKWMKEIAIQQDE